MVSPKKNRAVRSTVYTVVWGTVYGTLAQTVDGDVWRAAERALDVAVYRAVNLGVFRVVREAAKGDSEHPALLDFVRDAEERCRVPDPSSSGE